MINKLRYLFRLRRQSNTVKIIFIFGLIGIISIIRTGYYAWEIYHYANSPAEYVLAGDGTITQEQIDELLLDESVTMVSRQMEIPITIIYGGTKKVLDATMLSGEFIEGTLNVKKDSAAGTKRIYVDEETFSQVLRENTFEDEDAAKQSNSISGTSLDIRCQMDESTPATDPEGSQDGSADTSEPKYSTAKLISAKSVGAVHGTEESFIYIADSNHRLLKEACSLRVQFESHDLDGLQVKHLRALGYSIENEDIIQTEEYEIKYKLLHIQYGLLCFALCLLASCTLAKHYRKHH